VNQELEQYLRIFIDHRQEQWHKWLGTAEFAYNNKAHSSTQITPFKANYGQDPRMGFKGRKKGKYKGAKKFIKKMKEIQEEARAALGKAQEEMKKYADCYQWTVNVLSNHPRWMFKKNSMEFFIRLQPYLYYYYSGCTLESHDHMLLPECSMIT